MDKLFFALATLAVANGGLISNTYNTPSRGSFGGSSGGFISGGSSGGFIDGGSSGGFIDGGSSGGFISGGGSLGEFSHGGGSGGAGVGVSFGDGCGNGQIRGSNGGCIEPQITRNMYLYAAPAVNVETLPARNLPNPKVHLNYVFVRTENAVGGSRPVVVPPPKQKTLVYVLNRRPSAAQQEVIEVQQTPTAPELFFVNYDEGDDTQLPGGVSLQQALSQSVQQGQVIRGSGGIGGGSHGGSILGGGSHGGSFIGGGSHGGSIIDGGSISGGDIISGGSVSGGSSGYGR